MNSCARVLAFLLFLLALSACTAQHQESWRHFWESLSRVVSIASAAAPVACRAAGAPAEDCRKVEDVARATEEARRALDEACARGDEKCAENVVETLKRAKGLGRDLQK